jgi:ribose 5-phosphate isomerase B
VKIYIDADHNGFELKHELTLYLRSLGYEVIDLGAPKLDPDDDFPFAASRVAHHVRDTDTRDARGILICGSGQGVCIAANRFKGVRASLCWDNREAKASRNDSDSNVLCLPSHMLTVEKAKAVTHVWLHTPFAGAPRFKRRIQQIDELG